MILICSAGHKVDTSRILNRGRKSGERCGEELSYDRMAGYTYCRRILTQSDEGKPLTDTLFKDEDMAKKSHGGRRPGSGRKPSSEGVRQVVTVRLLPSEIAYLKALSGSSAAAGLRLLVQQRLADG